VQLERIYASVNETAKMEVRSGKGNVSPFLQLQIMEDSNETSNVLIECDMMSSPTSESAFAGDDDYHAPVKKEEDEECEKKDYEEDKEKEKKREISSKSDRRYDRDDDRKSISGGKSMDRPAQSSIQRSSSAQFGLSLSALCADQPAPVVQPIPPQPRAPVEASPAEKRVQKAKDRDEAQRVQDVEELRLQQLQLAQVTEDVAKPVVAARDYTTVPGELDAKFEALDDDNALCTTTIKAGLNWTKRYKESLLAAECEVTLDPEKQKDEKNKAYDLLDALTKSGTLLIEHSSLHIVCAATHCFGESLMNTVIKDNINPVEKVERSNLIVASVVHALDVDAIVDGGQVDRVKLYSPKLFLEKC